jgi:crossover junction endodeoxyribonuclease RuvC
MRYVGIDPSTKTGFVILQHGGEVEIAKEITSKVEKDPQRFMDLAVQIKKHLLETDVICIEGFSYGSKGAGVSVQYGIGWIIREELVRNGFTYHDVPPSSVKKFATGKGNAKKDAMVLPIYKKWGFEHKSDNVRDAFVLAQIANEFENTNPELGLTEYQKEVMKNLKEA